MREREFTPEDFKPPENPGDDIEKIKSAETQLELIDAAEQAELKNMLTRYEDIRKIKERYQQISEKAVASKQVKNSETVKSFIESQSSSLQSEFEIRHKLTQELENEIKEKYRLKREIERLKAPSEN